MTLELIISQQQTQITGNPECDNIQNVPWIQANIQFLNTIKGEPGNTPYIGENGNWWIGTTDTGNKAAGEDGKTPTIGENKHWFINGVDTGIIAEGQDGYTPQKGIDYFDGLTPYIGMNGNWWIGDVDQNIKAEGVDGISPTIGLNGNWYLGAVDTGVKAQGQDGYTPIKDVDYFDGHTPIKGVDYFDGITPTIGENKHWFIGAIDTGIVAEGIDGEDGVTPIITIGENENWYINGVDSGKPSRGANGTSAYEIYHAGGGTLSEVDFNASITDIPSHIADTTIHHTIDDLDVLYEPKNSNIQEHITDTDIHVTTTDKSNWDEKADLDEVLKLDQTTPQTIQGNVNINGNVNAVTTNVNQSTLPSVNASQDAAILQDGSAFTGTDYVMPTNNVAVKFVASADHTMGDFTVRVKSSATLTSTTAIITGYLYSDSAGSPSTLLATGNEIRHGSITTSYQELSLGTQYNLIAETTYWLVIRWSSPPTGGNIIFDSNTDINGVATSADATSWTLTNVRLRYRLRGRTFYGINGFSTNSYGVYGASTNSYGVYGASTNNFGVYGNSTNNYGVRGFSTNNYGVYGTSTNNYGVRGFSTNNYGVYGTSTNSFGVHGFSTNNFGVVGSSTNSFGVYGISTNRFGVHGESTNSYGVYGFSANSYGVIGVSTNNRAGYFSRNTATPTNAVPVVEIIQDHASDPNSVLDVKQDGTGEIARFFDSGVEVASIEKGGLGVYKKGVQIGDNTDVASVANEFAIRGRKGINGNIGFSVTEMCMPTDVGTWNWVEIVRNEWIIP